MTQSGEAWIIHAWSQESDDCVDQLRSALRVLDARLANIAARLDSMNSAMATKTDIAVPEATMLKWFIGAVLTVAGVAFAAAKLIP